MDKEEIRRKIRTYAKMNENRTTIYQNLWELFKGGLRRKYIAINTHMKETESCPKNSITFYFK